MSVPRPPTLARWLLERMLPPGDREHALGDVEEEHGTIAHRDGVAAANRWYWSQVWWALGPSIAHRARVLRFAAGRAGEVVQAVRSLRRRPGLAAAAVSTLALGIGSATAIFTVAEEVVWAPLPYDRGERLVQIWNTYDMWRGHEVLDTYWDNIALSWPEYEDLRETQTSFDDVAIYGATRLPVTGFGDPREVVVGLASSSLFPLLGVEAVVGRTFTAEEEGPGAARVVVLSHSAWSDWLGADPDVLGSSVVLAGTSYIVVGVLPRGFRLKTVAELAGPPKVAWVPVGGLGEELDRGNHSYEALGRLRAEVSILAAREDVGRILRGRSSPEERNARLTFRKTEEAGGVQQPVLILLAGVGLLLLIACGNYSTLLLGDVLRRRHEFVTRNALGAGGAAITRQLVTESTILGLIGAAVGFGAARWGTGFFLRLAPDAMALPEQIAPNVVVAAFGTALGLSVGVVVGLVPGWSARDAVMGGGLRSASRSIAGTPRGLQRGVLAFQVALSMVLLASGALLLRSARALEATDPGFDVSQLWSARVLFSRATHGAEEARQAYHEILARVEATSGVEGATLVSAMPFSGLGGSSSFQIVGSEVPDSEKQPEALRRTVFPGYHELVGIPLLDGRYLEKADGVFETPVVVVNQTFADRFWPEGDAVGGRIERDRREFEIVGVVGDALSIDLAMPARPTFFVPYDVAEVPFDMTVVVRSDLEPTEVAGILHSSVAEVDPTVPVEDFVAASELIARSSASEQFWARLVAAFAFTATLLCALGLFGTTTRAVATRRREWGIRLTLGAHRWELVQRTVADESVGIVLGLVIGVPAALLAGRVLVSVLYVPVGFFDLPSYFLAFAVLSAATLSAAAWAAARGSRLDPAEAIRYE